jgi:hypothetical protein
MRLPNDFSLGGWLTGAALLLFGIVARKIVQPELSKPGL